MIAGYIARIKDKLITNEAVQSFSVVMEQVTEDQGYFRARLWLVNGDFLEVAEYFRVVEGEVVTERYRYQWMDGTQRFLRKRWDNVPHFPDLDNFPHHVHVETEIQVFSSTVLSVIQVLDLVACELAGQGS